MKRSTSEDVRDLRSRKKTGEKKLSPHESKGLAKFKHIIAWIIVIAFIGTSGIMVLGIGSGAGKAPPPRQKGNPLEQNKKRNEADVKFWQDKIKSEPDNSQNYFNLGQIYISMEKEDEAEKNFNKAVELDPKNSLAMKYLAKIYLTQKKFKETEELLNKAAKVNQRDAELYTLLALAAQQQKKTPDAIKYLKQGIKADPGNLKLYQSLATMHHKAKDDEAAKKAIDEGFEIAKARHNKEGQIQLYIQLAYFAQDNKQTEKAVGHIRDAMKIAPGTPILYIYLANIYKNANDKASAKKAIQEGINAAKAGNDSRGVAMLEAMGKSLDQPLKPPAPKKDGKKDSKPGDKASETKQPGSVKPDENKPEATPGQ